VSDSLEGPGICVVGLAGEILLACGGATVSSGEPGVALAFDQVMARMFLHSSSSLVSSTVTTTAWFSTIRSHWRKYVSEMKAAVVAGVGMVRFVPVAGVDGTGGVVVYCSSTAC